VDLFLTVKLMKRIVLAQLAILACLFLCLGCSGVKPAPAPPVVAAASPQQSPSPSPGLTKRFVDAWLKGQAPPPDFSQGGGDGNYGWTFFGMILQCTGSILVNH
jgi:hypothetical protein